MKGGWFKINKGKLWNRSKLYITLDIDSLLCLTDSGAKRKYDDVVKEFGGVLARAINGTYSEVNQRADVKRKGSRYGNLIDRWFR